MKKSVFLTVFLGLFFASTSFALEPGDTLWTRTYGGSESDHCYGAGQTSDGGYILAGPTESYGAGDNDVYLIKTDANGDTAWTRTYGTSNWEEAWDVQQTSPDGGYIIVGATDSFGAGGCDVWLIKTDGNGDTTWTRTFGGSDDDEGRSVQQTGDGGYIIAGNTSSFGAGDCDFYLLKTDAFGDTVWTRTFGGEYWEEACEVQQTQDGGYVIVGTTESYGSGSGDAWLIKTDAIGDTVWTRTFGGAEWDEGWGMQQTSDGKYIITGHTTSFGAGNSDVYLIRVDADGNEEWHRTFGGGSSDAGDYVQQTQDGGYIIVGATESYGAGWCDIWLLKTDINGDTVWTRTYGTGGDDWGVWVEQTQDGGYIVAGGTSYYPYGPDDIWLLRIAGEELPAVSIEIVADDPPVTVPQGRSFGYTGTITNNTEDPQTTDIWVMAVGPLEGVYGPFKEFYDFPLDPGQSRSAHFNQRVPNLAPLGFYNYIAYCGDYPSTVIDSSFFQIEVVEGVGSSQAGWVLTGSFLEGDLADLPSESALLSNYPNPFNANTVISYQLPTTSQVKLEIYNLSGQKVATLVHSKEQGGYRSVTWDASDVSSGVYFYKLTAGDFTEIKRMTLLR